MAVSKYYPDCGEQTSELNPIFDDLCEKGILPPQGSELNPSAPMTRGGYLNLIGIFGDYPDLEDACLPDVAPDSPYYVGVSRALFMNALPENEAFRPDELLTKQDMAYYFHKLEMAMPFGPPGGMGSPGGEKTHEFTDFAQAGQYAVDSIDALLRDKVTEVDASGKFNPHANVTICDAAMMLKRYMDKPEMMMMGGHKDDKPLSSDGIYKFVRGDAGVQIHGETIESSTLGLFNVVAYDGADVHVDGCKLVKTLDAPATRGGPGPNNAVFGVSNGGRIEISDCEIYTDSFGANGVYSEGSDSYVSLTRVKIETKNDMSRGVYAYYDSTIVLKDCDIETNGRSCGAVATDTGLGNIFVHGGKYVTHGPGSPGIYCTGDVRAYDASFHATGAEGLVIVGRNRIYLNNCDVKGEKLWGLMFHQGGDMPGREELCPSFSMIGGRFEALAGPMFYLKEVYKYAYITLRKVQLSFASGVLLDYSQSRGSKAGPGSPVILTGYEQTLSGKIVGDRFSNVIVRLCEGSRYTGSINPKNRMKNTELELDESSVFTMDADCYINALSDKKADLSNIVGNGYIMYYDAKNEKNAWLNGGTYTLSGGGELRPE